MGCIIIMALAEEEVQVEETKKTETPHRFPLDLPCTCVQYKKIIHLDRAWDAIRLGGRWYFATFHGREIVYESLQLSDLLASGIVEPGFVPFLSKIFGSPQVVSNTTSCDHYLGYSSAPYPALN